MADSTVELSDDERRVALIRYQGTARGQRSEIEAYNNFVAGVANKYGIMIEDVVDKIRKIVYRHYSKEQEKRQ